MDLKTKRKVKNSIIEEFHTNPIVSSVCKKNGIARATFYRWIEEDEAFREKCINAKMIGIKNVNDLCESVLIGKIKEGKFSVIKFWLRANHEVYAFENKSGSSHTWHKNRIKHNEAKMNLVYDENDDAL